MITVCLSFDAARGDVEAYGRSYRTRDSYRQGYSTDLVHEYEKLKSKVPAAREFLASKKQTLDRELELVREYEALIARLPAEEQAFHAALGDNGPSWEGGWFEVSEIEGVGLRTTAICMAKGHELDDDKRALGALSKRVFGLKYLNTLDFTGYLKGGLNFARFEELSRLEIILLPYDVTDADVAAISNLRKLEQLHLGGCSQVDGEFLKSMPSDSRLKVLNLYHTKFDVRNATLLFSLEKLRTLTMP